MSIDLHIHSTMSDGTMSPGELVLFARKKGLSAIAVTDHDTIDGVELALLAGDLHGLEVVSGVELSVRYTHCNIHLLGYLFDHHQKALHESLQRLQVGRVERNKKIITKLNELGADIKYDELERVAGPGQCGRPHIAQLMMSKGVVKSMDEAFRNYLGHGGQAYISRFIYEAEEAIAIIKKAGGLAVLAHPLQLGKGTDDFLQVLKGLVAMGLDGIEAYYPTHSKKYTKELVAQAEKHNLLSTGGSDFHGNIRPNTTLAGGANVTVPSQLLVKMKERVEQNRNKLGIVKSN